MFQPLTIDRGSVEDIMRDVSQIFREMTRDPDLKQKTIDYLKQEEQYYEDPKTRSFNPLTQGTILVRDSLTFKHQFSLLQNLEF